MKGTFPAMVTPFDARGQIDFASVAKLIAWFRAAGCSGIVIAGTNGEGASLSAVEKRDLLKVVVGLADALPIILGVATASLEEAAWQCRQAHSCGAHAALVLPPSFFREVLPDGIAQWYASLGSRSPLPILYYHFPQRSGIALSTELLSHLMDQERIVGLKDSSGNPDNIQEFRRVVGSRNFDLYVGDETLLIAALKAGWAGTISGAANLLPLWLTQIVNDWAERPDSASTKHALILDALMAIRQCPQPMANKEVLHRLGIVDNPSPRLPLLAAPSANLETMWEKINDLNR